MPTRGWRIPHILEHTDPDGASHTPYIYVQEEAALIKGKGRVESLLASNGAIRRLSTKGELSCVWSLGSLVSVAFTLREQQPPQ